MIKAIIFDLDGVIVSTDQLHYEAWRKLAKKENIYFDKKINNKLRGVSRMDSLDIILEKASKPYTKQEKVELATYKNNIYKVLLDKLTENDILDGVVNTLDKLKASGFKVAIGSSSRNAKVILEKIGLENYFDAISDGTNITHSKPNPEVFEKAAKMLNISVSNCAVIEDALSGIEAAKACNMLAFAVGEAKSSPIKDYNFEDLLSVLKI